MMTAKIRTVGKSLTTTALAALMGLTAVAAQADPPRPGFQPQDKRYDQRYDDHRRGPDPRHDNRHDNRRYDPPGHAKDNYPRGAGPDHRWHRGDRIPPAYRSRSYVVEDWRTHRLSAPPRGYQWVQYGSDYLLVAIATGVITSMILNN